MARPASQELYDDNDHQEMLVVQDDEPAQQLNEYESKIWDYTLSHALSKKPLEQLTEIDWEEAANKAFAQAHEEWIAEFLEESDTDEE